MLNTGHVYALIDPITEEERYVGITKRSLEQRLNEHICGSSNNKTHKDKWISSLLRNNLSPRIISLEKANIDELFTLEKKWIKHFRDLNMPLTNGTNGGDGTWGMKHNESVKRRISESCKRHKRTPEQRKRYSEAFKGKPKSDAHKLAISLAVKKVMQRPDIKKRHLEAQRQRRLREKLLKSV